MGFFDREDDEREIVSRDIFGNETDVIERRETDFFGNETVL
jgi:hypothetical protein